MKLGSGSRKASSIVGIDVACAASAPAARVAKAVNAPVKPSQLLEKMIAATGPIE